MECDHNDSVILAVRWVSLKANCNQSHTGTDRATVTTTPLITSIRAFLMPHCKLSHASGETHVDDHLFIQSGEVHGCQAYLI